VRARACPSRHHRSGGGKQPIANEDQTLWVICNGEIYNYLELRAALENCGHTFRTASDTEVLLHLYEQKGEAMLNDLDGMFAFAILDENHRRLFLARDPFGEKPLYWAALPTGGLAFASEMKALLALPALSRDLDVAALAQFLALRYIPAPRTHVTSIRKLRAGEAMVVDGRGTRQWRYWRPRFPRPSGLNPTDRMEAIEKVCELVRESVRVRLRSDVPVGAFLSGGVDSTFIVSVIRELLPGTKVRTFCACFDSELLNEAPYAKEIAQRIGSEHHELHFSSSDMLSIFDDLIDHYDEPFGDYSMFPTFAICAAARRECTVMLSGDGGDECFGGISLSITTTSGIGFAGRQR